MKDANGNSQTKVSSPIVDWVQNGGLDNVKTFFKEGYITKKYKPSDDDLDLLKQIQELVRQNNGSSKDEIQNSIDLKGNENISAFVDKLTESVTAIDVSEEALENFGNGVGDFSRQITIADMAVKGFSVALNALGGLAVGMALQFIVEGFQNIINAQSDAINAANETADALKNTLQGYSDNMSTLNSFEDRLSTLAQGVDSIGNNVSLIRERSM